MKRTTEQMIERCFSNSGLFFVCPEKFIGPIGRRNFIRKVAAASRRFVKLENKQKGEK